MLLWPLPDSRNPRECGLSETSYLTPTAPPPYPHTFWALSLHWVSVTKAPESILFQSAHHPRSVLFVTVCRLQWWLMVS